MSADAADLFAAGRVVALCGGVGGAKLAFGLDRLLGPRLTTIVNTGDDFEHLGLRISPDVDTVLYTLANLADPGRGWGRADESWHFMEALGDLGGETWFRLGDRDLALHVERTNLLRAGMTLTDVTRRLAARLGIASRLLPMCDDPVRTIVHTPDGPLPFQRYFVERRCEPTVLSVTFDGIDIARPSPAVLAALRDSRLRAIVLCPSNPYLSIDPILAAPGVLDALRGASAPIVAVSPVIGGAAVKGPTTKIMRELGKPSTSAAIVDHYAGLLSGLVIDTADAAEAEELVLPVGVAATLMRDDADKVRLAGETLRFVATLASERPLAGTGR